MEPTEQQTAASKQKNARIHAGTLLILCFTALVLLAGLFKIIKQNTETQGIAGFSAFSVFLLTLIGYCSQQHFNHRNDR